MQYVKWHWPHLRRTISNSVVKISSSVGSVMTFCRESIHLLRYMTFTTMALLNMLLNKVSISSKQILLEIDRNCATTTLRVFACRRPSSSTSSAVIHFLCCTITFGMSATALCVAGICPEFPLRGVLYWNFLRARLPSVMLRTLA